MIRCGRNTRKWGHVRERNGGEWCKDMIEEDKKKRVRRRDENRVEEQSIYSYTLSYHKWSWFLFKAEVTPFKKTSSWYTVEVLLNTLICCFKCVFWISQRWVNSAIFGRLRYSWYSVCSGLGRSFFLFFFLFQSTPGLGKTFFAKTPAEHQRRVKCAFCGDVSKGHLTLANNYYSIYGFGLCPFPDCILADHCTPSLTVSQSYYSK